MVTLVAVVSVTMGVPGGFGRAGGQKTTYHLENQLKIVLMTLLATWNVSHFSRGPEPRPR